MRQVWISKIGRPEVLEVREAPDPHPGAGQVRIDVHAAGVNFADIVARMGMYPDAPPLPAVIGYEVSGIIDEAGDGVESVKEGDRVLAFVRFGGYSDKVVIDQKQALVLPDSLPTIDAAGIPVNYVTAWVMLINQGNLQPGNTVLVHSAGGGVGLAALQIATWREAKVIGTASPGKHERLSEMGIWKCIDYRTEDFQKRVKEITHGRGVDMALDAVGGDSFRKSYRSLAPLGKLFLFGVSSFSTDKKRNLISAAKGLVSMPRFGPISLMQNNRGVFGINMGRLWNEQEYLRKAMTDMMELFGRGVLSPVIDKTFPFDQAPQAHHYIQDRKNFGKVLLTPE
jgi:NADPH:quinone reductase-like Zn-dependent oxidoreductase